MRRRDDFRYTFSYNDIRKYHLRVKRVRVAKAKRSYFYRKRFWEIHFISNSKVPKSLKNLLIENKRRERNLIKHGKKIAYLKGQEWSFHGGNYGRKSWLETKSGKHIADLNGFMNLSEAKVLAAIYGYDRVIEDMNLQFVIE